jgi:hypothetical protein
MTIVYRSAAVLGVLALLVALVAPCNCAPVASTAQGHDCCLPKTGIQATSPACCNVLATPPVTAVAPDLSAAVVSSSHAWTSVVPSADLKIAVVARTTAVPTSTPPPLRI